MQNLDNKFLLKYLQIYFSLVAKYIKKKIKEKKSIVLSISHKFYKIADIQLFV